MDQAGGLTFTMALVRAGVKNSGQVTKVGNCGLSLVVEDYGDGGTGLAGLIGRRSGTFASVDADCTADACAVVAIGVACTVVAIGVACVGGGGGGGVAPGVAPPRMLSVSETTSK